MGSCLLLEKSRYREQDYVYLFRCWSDIWSGDRSLWLSLGAQLAGSASKMIDCQLRELREISLD